MELTIRMQLRGHFGNVATVVGLATAARAGKNLFYRKSFLKFFKFI